MSQLSSEQKTMVGTWISQGVSLSDVQARITQQFELSLTYMQVRMLVADLDVEIPTKPDPKPAVPAPAPVAENPASLPSVGDLAGSAPAPSQVSVDVDKITQPGAMASGTVVFSDGKKGKWLIDHTGYPRLIPPEPGYRPTQEDMYAVQDELAKALQKMGY